jgi:hypothetical protein
MYFNIILSSTPAYYKTFTPFKALYAQFLSHMPATRPIHLILPDVGTLIVFGGDCDLVVMFCIEHFLHPPAVSTLRVVLLNTQFSGTSSYASLLMYHAHKNN